MTRRIAIGLLALSCLLTAADKKAPQGHGEDDSVSIEAMILSQDDVKVAVGSDFGGVYTVLDVRISPKGGKPYDIHLDDFILRSESNGDHTGPMLPEQVAGAGAMVVQRTYGARSNPEMPPMLSGMKVEMKEQAGKGDSDSLALLKKKMLAEQTTSQPQSGLMFFALDKSKPKSLVLSCTTPSGKLRLQFR